MIESNAESEVILALADGRIFRGRSVGAEGTAMGEVVFTTSMSGYQEVLSDPSYLGQIVTMTSAEIGNVGVNEEDFESDGIKAAGLVVRSARSYASSWRSQSDLSPFLKERGVVAAEDIDTRALVLHIRSTGAQMGVMSTDVRDPDALVTQAREARGMAGRELARDAMCKAPFDWTEAPSPLQHLGTDPQGLRQGPQVGADRPRPRVVALDFGIKRSMLRRLVESGAQVHVVPGTTSAEDVLALKPDGVFLSNGPADPAGIPYAPGIIRDLVGHVPLMGICLGHQLLGLALGGKTERLKFGHHGCNHPVMDLETEVVEITSQNHNFVVDIDSLDADTIEVTHLNLNDRTVEGLRHRKEPIVSLQYHPEAAPGPHDAAYLFQRFRTLIREA